MYVERDFEGRKSKPWEGGQYGYVRGPRRSGGAVVYTSIHEGIDIRPTARDSAGEPADRVVAAANGRVVYANERPGASNYGRYVVIEHVIRGSPYYSLYAHLASVNVAAGDPVLQGDPIGKMGHSGTGLDRERAHTHFEFGLMLSPNFDVWYPTVYPDANPHGKFNGRNLAGIDPAAVILAARKEGDTFDPARQFRAGEPYFKVAVPAPADLPLLRLYPWLLEGSAPTKPRGWTISFSRFAVPVRIEPYLRPISEPVVTWVRETRLPDSSATRGLVTTSGASPKLTRSGRQLIDLICTPSK